MRGHPVTLSIRRVLEKKKESVKTNKQYILFTATFGAHFVEQQKILYLQSGYVIWSKLALDFYHPPPRVQVALRYDRPSSWSAWYLMIEMLIVWT